MAETNEFFREVDEEYRRDRIAADLDAPQRPHRRGSSFCDRAAVGGWRYWQHVRAQRAPRRPAAATRTRSASPGRQGRGGREGAGARRQGGAGRLPAARPLPARRRDSASASAGRRREGLRRARSRRRGERRCGRTSRGCAPRCCASTSAEPPRSGRRSSASPRRPAPGGTPPARCSASRALKAGDYDFAGRWFDQIAADRDTPPGLRTRLEIYTALVAAGPVQSDPVARREAEMTRDRRHRRPAERRQIDPVQPARRQEARARRRPPGRDPRPARGRGAARRPRLHASSTPPASRRRDEGSLARPHARADRGGHRRGRRRSCS